MRLVGAKKTWALLLAVVGVLLVLAAPAAAEVRGGSASSPANPGIAGEADILSAAATYDSTAGTVTFTITTREAPGSTGVILLGAGLGVETAEGCDYPVVEIASLSNQASAVGLFVEREEEFEEGLTAEKAQKSVLGTTTTLTFTSSRILGKPFDCAEIFTIDEEAEESEEEETLDEVDFALSPVQTPPPSNPNPPSTSTPSTPTTTSPPAPAPKPALAFGKSKTVKAKPGKWTQVKVQMSNPGTGATGPVALKVKAPKGVKLKPGSGKVNAPALQAGKSETVTFKVELTEKAKAESKLSLAATSGALSATGSVVVKSAG